REEPEWPSSDTDDDDDDDGNAGKGLRDILFHDLREAWARNQRGGPAAVVQHEVEMWQGLMRRTVVEEVPVTEGRMGMRRPEPLLKGERRSLLRFCEGVDDDGTSSSSDGSEEAGKKENGYRKSRFSE
ncbi:MAG: hypothetical protein Q9210_007466, partial [Variospora velana]